MQIYTELPTPNGTLRGFFHRPNQDKFPVVIMFHGFKSNKAGPIFSFTKLARILETQGVASMRLDFLGSGDSDLNFVDMTYSDELSCARLMIEEVMKMENCTGIYLLGHSMGGLIASELAELYPEVVKKLVLWAPAYNFPDLLRSIKQAYNNIKLPVYDESGYEVSDDFVEEMMAKEFYEKLPTIQAQTLIIHGTKDIRVPYEEVSKKYLEKLPMVTLETLEDADHNFLKIEHIKKVIKLSYDFLIND